MLLPWLIWMLSAAYLSVKGIDMISETETRPSSGRSMDLSINLLPCQKAIGIYSDEKSSKTSGVWML
jgi:hypothetical protein